MEQKLTWAEGEPPQLPRPNSPGDWFRVIYRGLAIALVNFGGLMLMLMLRLLEWPIYGVSRPWTPHITRYVCILSLRLLGLKRSVIGVPIKGPGAFLSNHVSWLDIFALNSCQNLYFISKAEVAHWPGIGWLAKATGTLFIQRKRGRTTSQIAEIRKRLEYGHLMVFFPEGTSTDGLRVLPFRSALLEPFTETDADINLQPVSLSYIAPQGEEPYFYGWWGDMDFGTNLIVMLAKRRHGEIVISFHPPLSPLQNMDRKALAQAATKEVRNSLEQALSENSPAASIS